MAHGVSVSQGNVCLGVLILTKREKNEKCKLGSF